MPGDVRRGFVFLISIALIASAAAHAPSQEGGGEDGAGGKKAAGSGKYSGGCLDEGCHADLKEVKQVHGPVAVGACDVCHLGVASEEHSFELARDEEELCTFCHAPKPLEVKHKPFEVGSCESCHSPHGGADRDYLLEGMTADTICGECHEKEEHAVAHEPYAEGQCTKCHSPHQSAESALLRREPRQVCLGCHEQLAMDLRAGASVHKPVKDGNCGTCHEPHGGSLPWMLTAGYPKSLYVAFNEDAYELCLVCHSADAFTEATSTETGFRDGDRNLHFLHVNNAEKGRSCQICHSAHAGSGPRLIRKEVSFGNWKLPLGFEATPTGGTCTSGCHKPLTYSRGSAEPEEGSEGEPSEEAPVEEKASEVAPGAR